MDLDREIFQFWKNATVDEQIENLGKILEKIEPEEAREFWKEIKFEITNDLAVLIFRRFIKDYTKIPLELINECWEMLEFRQQVIIVQEELQKKPRMVEFFLNLSTACKLLGTRSKSVDDPVKTVLANKGDGILEGFENESILEIFGDAGYVDSIRAVLRNNGEVSIEGLDNKLEIIANHCERMPKAILNKYLLDLLKEGKVGSENLGGMLSKDSFYRLKIEVKKGIIEYILKIRPLDYMLLEKLFRSVLIDPSVEEVLIDSVKSFFYDSPDKTILKLREEDLKTLSSAFLANIGVQGFESLESDVQKSVIDYALKKETLNEHVANKIQSILKSPHDWDNACAQSIKEHFDKGIKFYGEEELSKVRERLTTNCTFFEFMRKELKLKDNVRYSKAEHGRGLVIYDASDLPTDKLEELRRYFEVQEICVEDSSCYSSRIMSYNIDTYIECRREIDTLLDGIDLSLDRRKPDSEKRIFGQVISRLARHISHDYETIEKENKGLETDGTRKSRNMEGGLLEGKSVCGGYAEIVRNVFACCGIEARYILGKNKNPEKKAHAWNQIKLDGTWYNMDLTWDRDRIVNGQPTRYLLISDFRFDHDEYNITSDHMMCLETCYNVDRFIYSQLPRESDMNQFLVSSFLDIRQGEIIPIDVLHKMYFGENMLEDR